MLLAAAAWSPHLTRGCCGTTGWCVLFRRESLFYESSLLKFVFRSMVVHRLPTVPSWVTAAAVAVLASARRAVRVLPCSSTSQCGCNRMSHCQQCSPCLHAGTHIAMRFIHKHLLCLGYFCLPNGQDTLHSFSSFVQRLYFNTVSTPTRIGPPDADASVSTGQPPKKGGQSYACICVE